jgi:RHS repeat-associated protein
MPKRSRSTIRSVRVTKTRATLVLAITAALVAAVAVPAGGATATAATTVSVPAPKFGKPVKTHHAARASVATPASSKTESATATVLVAGASSVATPIGGAHGHVSTKAVHGATSATVDGAWQKVGKSGLQVAAASTSGEAPAASVRVTVLSKAERAKAHVEGPAISIARADGKTSAAPVAVRVPASVLQGTFGADYASRVQWVQTPVTTLNASDAESVTPVTPVAQTMDVSSDSIVVTPMVAGTAVLLAAAAAPVATNGTGNFAATPLSSSSSWDVSPQTGDFSWQYAMRTPPAAAGPEPSLSLNYDSQSVDGETGSTNNQPSAVGEGWSLAGGGFIERNYVSCSLDDTPVTTSGDLCWKSDNATLSVAGHSGLLVKDKASGGWKLQSDDGSKFEHLVGASAGCGAANGTYDDDCWRMTTRDGTRYYFGMNELPGWATGKVTTNSAWTVPVFGNDSGEPCHASTFAASSCVQAWRWNLDYVVDAHGNAEALYYNAETNKYSRGGSTVVSYTRGGQLARIEYGLTSSTVYGTNAADDKVVLGYDAYGRCSDSAHTNCTSEAITAAATAPAHPTYYPDVPFDQLCTGTTCTQKSPSFFTDGMLDTVTTQALVAGAYQTVDTWTLSHSFPAPGDSTNAALWLTQVVHKGTAGLTPISEPATKFTGVTMQNRVWVKNGLAPLDKWRISSITTSLGGVISVNYSAQQCTATAAPTIEASPWSNTNWCFPAWWTPDVLGAQTPQEDLFHKYVVSSVIANPKTGGGLDATQETDYVYGTPRWRYDNSPLTPTKQRTWNQYAGVDTVQTRVGDHSAPTKQQVTLDTYFQGMNGDRAGTSGGAKTVNVTGTSIPDALWFAGQVYEEKTLLGVGGATLSDTVNTPWASAVTSDDGTNTARMTDVADTVTTEPVAAGGNRTTETKTTFDSTYGYPLTVSTIHSDTSSTCATTSYTTANTSAWIIGLPKEVQTVGLACADAGSAQFPKDLLGDTRTYYDNSALGTVGAKGDVTSTAEVDSYTGSTANWVTASTSTYDALGRVLVAKDVLGHSTTNAYTPADSAGPLTSESVTNTLGWKTTTAFNPAWGAETSYTDQNNHVTTAVYDGLGRRTQVWLPQHTQAANPTSPSMSYAYTLSQTAANAIATTTLGSGGNDLSYQLFDGLGQPTQTQTAADGGGTIVATTGYDTAGRADWQDNAYWTTSVNPSAVLAVPSSETTIPSQQRTTFDGAGRPTAVATWATGTERFETDTAYKGNDEVDTTPPTGGTASSVFTDSAGNKTKLVQYSGHTVTGTGQATTYAYDAAGRMTTMTDPAGNAWSWGFDLLGHQTTAKDPDTGTTTSTYDDAGNRLSTTDARGQQLTYTYDALNRKTAEYSGTASGSLLDSWTYDSLAKGDLTSSSSYTGSTAGTPGAAYTTTVGGYDAADQPTSTTISIPSSAPAFGGTSYTVKYTRGADEAVVTQSDPAAGGLAAEAIRHPYTSDGRWSSLGTTVLGVTFAYTPIRQLGTIDRFVPPPDGQPTAYEAYSSYGYDQATGAVTGIQDNATFASAGHWVAQRSYVRDNVGDITQSTTTANYPSTATQVNCYSYDGYGELTQVFTPGTGSTCATTPSTAVLGGPALVWDSYTYDTRTGDRTGETVHATTTSGTDATATYSYPDAGSAQPHAVTTIAGSGAPGVGSYGYDQAGNTTSAPGQTLTYDEEGRVASDDATAGTLKNVYDASGSLLLQTDTTQGASLYLGDTVLHQKGTAPINAVRTYSTQSGTPIVERSGATGGSVTMTWLFTDVDGNVDVQTDATAGTTKDSYRDPFGNAVTGTGIWGDGDGFLNHPATATTGLVSLGARFYDPAIGRFVSVDPLLESSDPMQVNGYAYAGNSPITNTDASGLCANYATGVMTMLANCAGGHGSNKADAATVNYQKATSTPKKAAAYATVVAQQDAWVYAGAINYTKAANAGAKALKKAITAPAKPGHRTLGEQVQEISLDAQYQMLWLNQAADMPEEDAGAELAVGLRGIPAVTARLQSYVDKAAKDYEAGLIRKSGPQVRAVGRHPFLEAPFRGQVIDNAVKSAARNDPDLSHLWISRPGEFGPDFHDIDTNTWWDVTTPGQWQAHVDLYIDPFGAGIGLFTK